MGGGGGHANVIQRSMGGGGTCQIVLLDVGNFLSGAISSGAEWYCVTCAFSSPSALPFFPGEFQFREMLLNTSLCMSILYFLGVFQCLVNFSKL